MVKGEGIVGLARAFMYAGTPSVLASLWSINDQSTAEFMGQFYHRLSQGKSKAAALREAKRAMIRSKAYSHPYYWAPFVLIGEGQERLVTPPVWVYSLAWGGALLGLFLVTIVLKRHFQKKLTADERG